MFPVVSPGSSQLDREADTSRPSQVPASCRRPETVHVMQSIVLSLIGICFFLVGTNESGVEHRCRHCRRTRRLRHFAVRMDLEVRPRASGGWKTMTTEKTKMIHSAIVVGSENHLLVSYKHNMYTSVYFQLVD